jgi:hypothetical protein
MVLEFWRWYDKQCEKPATAFVFIAGIYIVKEVITGLDGCVSDTLRKSITIGTKPVADFQIFDTCIGKPARIINQSTNLVGTINQWSWILDGNIVAIDQQPTLIASTPGLHTVKLVVRTNVGCESDTVTKTFIANPAPMVNITAQDGCINVPINFLERNQIILQRSHNGTGILEMVLQVHYRTLYMLFRRWKYECSIECDRK